MGSNDDNVPCYLVLEDGTVLPGKSFGAKKPTDGEVAEKGSILGKIAYELPISDKVDIVDPNLRNLVEEVSVRNVTTYNKGGSPRICAIDCGLKYNQIKCLVKRGCRVDVVPWNHQLNIDDYDGLFLSNGPGNPEMCKQTILNISSIINSGKVKLIFGICLGHQLLSMAIGCKSFKMKYGNRGHNQPCIHHGTERCFMTSQNHGFAIDQNTLPKSWEPLFTNANDHTNEGIIHSTVTPKFNFKANS